MCGSGKEKLFVWRHCKATILAKTRHHMSTDAGFELEMFIMYSYHSKGRDCAKFNLAAKSLSLDTYMIRVL